MEIIMPLLIAVTLLMGVSSEPYQEFSKNSNGMDEYAFVKVTPCMTGKSDSGYAIAPFGNVMLKQVNTDGTVSTPVCDK
jgi:hypothetical protein